MLREQIIAYVTGTINAHTKSSLSKGMMNIKDDTAEEFEKFLDFIEDIPEVKVASEDTEELKKTIEKLEESLILARIGRDILRSTVEYLETQLKEKNGLEQYADFTKAIRTFREEGKDIQCKIPNLAKHIYRRTDFSGCLKDERSMPLSAYEIVFGKWTIEGEEE